MTKRAVSFTLLVGMACSTGPEPVQNPLLARGISATLANARSTVVSGIRYDLHFDLRNLGPSIAGRATLEFELAARAHLSDLVLDFAGSDLRLENANGAPPAQPPRQQADHWVLPAGSLRPGRNVLVFQFSAPLAPAGAPLIWYHDAQRSEDFVYTLLVPSDAHRLFPCFDQPDLRGKFRVELQLPARWISVANVDSGYSAPLPTYLFAFAAGPFERVEKPGMPRVFVRPSRRAELEDAVATMNAQALAWLERWFAVPYAFPKLDVVLLPAFPYGGMEHAGAIFYRENALLFDHAPTASELHRRSTLIYHEVAHQWFGNLVTMRWFDNLWLKEGFATFLAYRALEGLEPDSQPWLRFLQGVKPAAYAVDVTPGTTPIWQELRNLDDAKSNYGPIVYNKAPAVLRELEARLGEEPFRRGVSEFLRRHAMGSARWDDLIAALSDSSGQDLKSWSERWILAAGMPRVRAQWTIEPNAEQGVPGSLVVTQESTLGDRETWPLHLDILIGLQDGSRRTIAIDADARTTRIRGLDGVQAPCFVLLNSSDVAYGQFLLDAASSRWWLDHLADESSDLVRAIVCRQLEDGVREGEIDPQEFAKCLLKVLPRERDAQTHAGLLTVLATTILRYQTPERGAAQRIQLTDHAMERLASGPADQRLATFRFVARASADPRVLAFCEQVALGFVPFATGLEDRFVALAALRAAGKAVPAVENELQKLSADEARRLRYLAEAASADPATKQRLFTDFCTLGSPPEQWAQDSLPFFHWPGQDALTLPFLPRALDQIAWVKRNRKIFFMPAWIDAFVNGQASPAALQVVDEFLADRARTIDPDVRRKVLQSRDGLARAVAIRAKWTSGG